MRLVVALVGLAISFALPTFAQSPQLREALATYDKKEEEAFNNNDAVALAALYTEDAVEVTDSGTLYGSGGHRETLCRPVPERAFQQLSREGRSVFPSHDRYVGQRCMGVRRLELYY